MADRSLRPRPRRLGRVLLWIAAALVLALAGLAAWARARVAASLPQESGRRVLAGLAAPVTVARDALGVPTIRGASRLDVARATGFVHAQERFFQMDLLRRRAAGELAELLGPGPWRWIATTACTASAPVARAGGGRRGARRPRRARGLRRGRQRRPRRARARRRSSTSSCASQPRALDARRTRSSSSSRCSSSCRRRPAAPASRRLGVMHDTLPRRSSTSSPRAAREWDAPLVGGPIAAPPIPGPDVFDLRHGEAAARRTAAPPGAAPGRLAADGRRCGLRLPRATASRCRGSNNWAVAGATPPTAAPSSPTTCTSASACRTPGTARRSSGRTRAAGRAHG